VLAPDLADARTWRDATGRFKVEADFVSANDELVVVRAPARLLAFELKELSVEDRDYVAAKLLEKPSTVLSNQADGLKRRTDIDETKSENLVDDSSSSNAVDAESMLNGQADNLAGVPSRGQWTLTIPDVKVEGDFFGFSFEPLIVSRRGDQIAVGNTLVKDLPALYRAIVPPTVGQLEGVEIPDLRTLQKWVQRTGAGPWQYEVESLVIDNKHLGRLTIPLFLLDTATLALIEQPYERWKVAHASEDTAELKDRYLNRERFLTRAQLAELVTADVLAANAVQRQIQLMRLEQLAANTNVTDLWEVMLIPPGYGYPVSVILPGRTSAEAQQIALAQYPGFTLSGISKATY